MAKKQSGEEILEQLASEGGAGAGKAREQIANALKQIQDEKKVEEPAKKEPKARTPRQQRTSKNQPTPDATPEAPPTEEARLSSLTDKLKAAYQKRGGTKGIAKKAGIGLAKGAGKLALGGIKLGLGSALGLGSLVAGGTIQALGLGEIATAALAGSAAVGSGIDSLFKGGSKNDNVRAAGGGTGSSANVAGNLQSLEALMGQLVALSNNILSATRDNSSNIQDVVTAINRQTSSFAANTRQTNDILNQINASILGMRQGSAAGGPSKKEGGLLGALSGLFAGLMDSFKFLRGLLSSVLTGITKLGSWIARGFSSLKGLFTKGAVVAAEEAGAKLAAEGAEKLAAEGAEKLAVEGAEKLAAEGAEKLAAEGATKLAQGAVPVAEAATGALTATGEKAAVEGAGKLATVGAEKAAGSVVASTIAKAAGSTALKAIPLLGDIAIGALEGYESGSVGQGIAAGIGSLGGRIAGAIGGTAVAPGVGTFVGEVGGSLAGAAGGAALYKSIANWVGGNNKPGESLPAGEPIYDAMGNFTGQYEPPKEVTNLATASMAQARILERMLTPTENQSSIPFSQQSAMMALQTNTTTPPPVIINNNNMAAGGGGGMAGSNSPPRSSGAVRTSPEQSHIDRALYGDMFGSGVP